MKPYLVEEFETLYSLKNYLENNPLPIYNYNLISCQQNVNNVYVLIWKLKEKPYNPADFGPA